jgi:Immunoglobulin domain
VSNHRFIVCLILAPARIIEAPLDKKVIDGGTVSLVCRAAGNPKPEVYWRRSGRRIVSSTSVAGGGTAAGSAAPSESSSSPGGGPSRAQSRFLVVEIPHGSVLRIEPVRVAPSRRDDGIYTNHVFECVAANGVGEQATASVTVSVYAHQDVGRCHSVLLSCIYGMFSSIVMWLHKLQQYAAACGFTMRFIAAAVYNDYNQIT